MRSLVVAGGARSCGTGRRLVRELEKRALVSGFESLTAFTHTPGYFVQLGFSIVPHTWLPEKIEADLMALLPAEEWTMFGHRMIYHGRQVCHARRPRCEACGLSAVCPKAGLAKPARPRGRKGGALG